MSKILLVDDHLELTCDCGIQHTISESADGEPVCESVYRKDGATATDNGGTSAAEETVAGTEGGEEEGAEGAAQEPAAADTVKVLGLTFKRSKAA